LNQYTRDEKKKDQEATAAASSRTGRK